MYVAITIICIRIVFEGIAFDTLDYKILLYKLKNYDVHGRAGRWFRSYLGGRRQYADFKGKKSALVRIEPGVAQGSVFEPLLFILYTNEKSQKKSE